MPSSKIACVAEPPMGVKSPATAIPELEGLLPGVTVMVNNVELPAITEDGFALPEADGFVGGAVTVRDIDAEALLAWASVTLVGSDFPPGVVAIFTVA